MLVESNPILDATSFDRERAVRKHIGDFTLFFSGFFPEAIASLPRIHPLSVDAFVDYVAAGKESYAVVAAFNLFEYRDEAPLFKRLSERFEDCVDGLHLVKREILRARSVSAQAAPRRVDVVDRRRADHLDAADFRVVDQKRFGHENAARAVEAGVA